MKTARTTVYLKSMDRGLGRTVKALAVDADGNTYFIREGAKAKAGDEIVVRFDPDEVYCRIVGDLEETERAVRGVLATLASQAGIKGVEADVPRIRDAAMRYVVSDAIRDHAAQLEERAAAFEDLATHLKSPCFATHTSAVHIAFMIVDVARGIDREDA